LTGVACVSRIYSDLATLSCGPDGLALIDIVEGLDVAELSKLIGLPVRSLQASKLT
jgi:3-oxoadipate CoA-transferase beta subunit